MAARPIRRGQIRLALVSIPAELFPATKSGAQIQFHQVHEPTGKRIKYEKVVPGVGPVDKDEIVKGYEVSKGHSVLLAPEENESVKLERRKPLDLVQFVDDDEIHKSSGFFRDIGDHNPDPDLLDKASMLIERKAGEFDPKEFHNRYVDALHRLIEKKQKAKGGQKIIEEEDEAPQKGSNVIDLMAALKKSL